MEPRAILSLGLVGSHAPYIAFGRPLPVGLHWNHMPLSALERWQIPPGVVYEKVLVDLRAFTATEPLAAPAIDAWKATLNSLLTRLVHGEGRVPLLVGYSETKDWGLAALAVRLGMRELLTLDELHGEFVARASVANPTGLGELIPFPSRPAVSATNQVALTLPKSTVPFPIEGLEGNSVAIEVVRATIRKAAPTSSSVLIIGPTGSGKERVAHALHRYGDRASKAFRVVDCAAISPELFESEFFGHVAGAFTGAAQDRKGAFELAHEGILFIDQIHLLPLSQQAKLLRALQEKKFTPVGSETIKSVDIRVIASSQLPLEQLVHSGHFREDLYFRLKVIDIFLPALVERRSDIPIIAESLLKKHAKESKKPPLLLGPACLEKILLYEWPGNIRELGNAMERACTLAWSDGRSEIHVADLPESIQFAVMKSYKTQALKDAVKRFEQEYIAQTVRRFGGSKDDAAEALGLSLATLYRKLGSN
ncbi:MAG: sigma-54 dependent transcriptional regulator [Bdellovibrionota bacterium]